MKRFVLRIIDEMYKTAWYEMTDKLSAIGDMKLMLSTEAKVLLTEFNKETGKRKEMPIRGWHPSFPKSEYKLRNGVPLLTFFPVEKMLAQGNILHCRHQQ